MKGLDWVFILLVLLTWRRYPVFGDDDIDDKAPSIRHHRHHDRNSPKFHLDEDSVSAIRAKIFPRFTLRDKFRDTGSKTNRDARIPFARNQLIRHTARVFDRYYTNSSLSDFEIDWTQRQLLIHNHSRNGLENLTISELIENLKGLRERRRRSSLKVKNKSSLRNTKVELDHVEDNFIEDGFPLALAMAGGNVPPVRPSKKVAEIDGEIILGGLMMVHERGPDSITCGPIMPQGGIQALETMLYTVDYINAKKHEDILPGIKLGAHILDDCDTDTRGLQESLDFIKGSISNIDDVDVGHCANDSFVKNKVISGVVGASSSVTSIQVANLLRLFKIPQVSFFSTSPELSNKQRYDYFARTIPSDKNQVQVMFDIIDKFGWKYVSIIYEESNYGTKALEELEKLLPKRNICIAAKEMLVKDSGVADESSYDAVVSALQEQPKAKGVIIFGSDQEVKALMAAVRRKNATGQFIWIGSDGWSARTLVSDGHEREVEGTLSVQPRANKVIGFDKYFFSLNVNNNTRNPWFIEFWEHHFQCKFPNTTNPRYRNFTRICTGEEKLTPEDTQFEAQLQFVSDAVMAFAYALRDMHRNICGGKLNPGVCNKMKPVDGTTLLGYLKNVSFVGLSKDHFHFDAFSDGPARYNIIHFRRIEDKYVWIPVGEYNEGNLTLDMSKIQFADGTSVPPVSVCADACGPGEAMNRVSGSSASCCWNCDKCIGDQIRHEVNESVCFTCALGTLPDPLHTKCVPIPEVYLRPSSGWAIGAMAFASVGIILTLFVLVVFLLHNETPVVRASGRELSYVLLLALLLCYALTFLFVVRPTDVICGIQQFSTGLFFTMVYATLLTKTNRIARIFQAGKRSARRPSFISPRSQLVICALLLCIQVIVLIVWMLLQPPQAIHHYPLREDNMLVCNSYINASYTIAFAYPLTLIVVCTVYAVLTRKIPESFNESKYIGFTMYTTCIIWLAFVPIYFSTAGQVALRIMSMTVAISLSATVMVACLFVPKLYIILLHPERNVRQSMMPTGRHSTMQPSNPAPAKANNPTQLKAQPQAIPMTTIQNTHNQPQKSTKSMVDSGTQSDAYGIDNIILNQKDEKMRHLHLLTLTSGQVTNDLVVKPILVSTYTQTENEDSLEYSTSSQSNHSLDNCFDHDVTPCDVSPSLPLSPAYPNSNIGPTGKFKTPSPEICQPHPSGNGSAPHVEFGVARKNSASSTSI